jgi:hypothetical protein
MADVSRLPAKGLDFGAGRTSSAQGALFVGQPQVLTQVADERDRQLLQWDLLLVVIGQLQQRLPRANL